MATLFQPSCHIVDNLIYLLVFVFLRKKKEKKWTKCKTFLLLFLLWGFWLGWDRDMGLFYIFAFQYNIWLLIGRAKGVLRWLVHVCPNSVTPGNEELPLIPVADVTAHPGSYLRTSGVEDSFCKQLIPPPPPSPLFYMEWVLSFSRQNGIEISSRKLAVPISPTLP